MQYSKAATRVDKAITPGLANYYRDKTCIVCGDSFKSNNYYAKYCSQRCVNDAHIARRRNKVANKRAKAKACAVCAAPLTQADTKIKAYCSNACKQKAYRLRHKPCL